MERLSIMIPSKTISLKDLPPEITRNSKASEPQPAKEEFLSLDTIKTAVASFERDYIVEKLRENNGNISKTAEKIGIARRNLTHKIKSYDIDMNREGIQH